MNALEEIQPQLMEQSIVQRVQAIDNVTRHLRRAEPRRLILDLQKRQQSPQQLRCKPRSRRFRHTRILLILLIAQQLIILLASSIQESPQEPHNAVSRRLRLFDRHHAQRAPHELAVEVLFFEILFLLPSFLLVHGLVAARLLDLPQADHAFPVAGCGFLRVAEDCADCASEACVGAFVWDLGRW